MDNVKVFQKCFLRFGKLEFVFTQNSKVKEQQVFRKYVVSCFDKIYFFVNFVNIAYQKKI